jgi:hypothetical protein
MMPPFISFHVGFAAPKPRCAASAIGPVHALAKMRFADELSLNGAVRGADHKGSTGKVLAYNAGVIYAPISNLRDQLL